jgi:hypothetical protein
MREVNKSHQPARVAVCWLHVLEQIYSANPMSTASKNPNTIRPWYRPLAASIAVALAVAGLLVVLNSSGFVRMHVPRGIQWQKAWPLTFLTYDAYVYRGSFGGLTDVADPRGPGTFPSLALVVDCVVTIATVVAVAALAEHRIRRRGRLAQFNLREMLALVAVVSIVAGREASVQRRQREGIEQVFGPYHHFEIDEGVPHWVHRYLPGWPLRPFDRVCAAELSGPRHTGDELSAIAKFDYLAELVVNGDWCDDDALRHVGRLPRLQRLTIISGRVTGRGLPHLAELGQLRQLSLHRSDLHGADLRHLQPLRRLEALSLSGTHVSDGDLAPLADLPVLESLDSSSTPIADAGLAHLAPCRHLRTLDLSQTRITDRGLPVIVSLDRLERIHLCDTCVSEAAAARLRAALPGCKVILRY